jgi:hypothetical protein
MLPYLHGLANDGPGLCDLVAIILDAHRLNALIDDEVLAEAACNTGS